jgi:ribA/ribD-fused uncharacterized protein
MNVEEFKDEYSFLSNFFNANQALEGLTFPTNEHWFQSRKTKVFKERVAIETCYSPSTAKRLGRQVTLRKDWDKVKTMIMMKGLRAKFKQNKDIAKKLKETYPHKLTEGNYWHDNYWGDCFCPKCKNIKGANMLGKLLELVRINLKE